MTLTRETAETLGWQFFHNEEGGWTSHDENKVGRQLAQGPQKAATDTVQVPREPSYAARKNLPDKNGAAEQHAHSPEGLLDAIEAWEAQYRPVKPDEPVEPVVVPLPDAVAFPGERARAEALQAAGEDWRDHADHVWGTVTEDGPGPDADDTDAEAETSAAEAPPAAEPKPKPKPRAKAAKKPAAKKG